MALDSGIKQRSWAEVKNANVGWNPSTVSNRTCRTCLLIVKKYCLKITRFPNSVQNTTVVACLTQREANKSLNTLSNSCSSSFVSPSCLGIFASNDPKTGNACSLDGSRTFGSESRASNECYSVFFWSDTFGSDSPTFLLVSSIFFCFRTFGSESLASNECSPSFYELIPLAMAAMQRMKALWGFSLAHVAQIPLHPTSIP